MKILFYAGGWPTNIGNSFIDHCSIYIIKTVAPNANLYFASELPRWFYKVNQKNMNNSLDLAELMEIDFLVVSGMVLCDEFIELEGPIIKKLSDQGVKIIFNGCGGSKYTQIEVDNFKRFIECVNISGFISRDEVTYNNYKDCFPRSHNGIDCAFFLSKVFNPAPLKIKDYVVYNFDHMEEPKIEEHNKKIIRTHHSCYKFFPKTYTAGGIHLFLSTRMPFIKIIKHNTNNRYFKYKDTLISDITDDYLNLYANSYSVYSDRVHACIATLSFGKSARLYSSTPRSYIFDRVGCGEIRDKLVKLDMDKLNIEQEKHIAFLGELFGKE